MNYGPDWPLIGSTALSIVAGLLGAVIWDGFAKPSREKRILARTLMVEVELNAGMLSVLRNKLVGVQGRIFPKIALMHELYRSNLGRIGELPVEVARQVVEFHGIAQETEGYPLAHEKRMERRERAESIAEVRQIDLDDRHSYAAMATSIEILLQRGGPLMTDLFDVANPRWALRRYFKRRPELPTPEGIAAVMASRVRQMERVENETEPVFPVIIEGPEHPAPPSPAPNRN